MVPIEIFLWKDNREINVGNQSHIHSVACNKICRPKSERCLRIRKIEHINATFLAKQRQKILIQPDSTRVHLIKTSYLKEQL